MGALKITCWMWGYPDRRGVASSDSFPVVDVEPEGACAVAFCIENMGPVSGVCFVETELGGVWRVHQEYENGVGQFWVDRTTKQRAYAEIMAGDGRDLPS